MPVRDDAAIEVSAYSWVPPFARGLVRDLRVRWALEEAGLDYRERLLDPREPRPADYMRDQPFGQVPVLVEGPARIFESGAIVLHIAERSEVLLPADPAARARAISWIFASLNSIEPFLNEFADIEIFSADKPWAALKRPDTLAAIGQRLKRLSRALGDKDYLEGTFTAGDLMMTTMLRSLRGSDIVAGFPNLAALQARCEARPAFRRALADQMAAFERHDAVAAA